jgi:hypothetical protein
MRNLFWGGLYSCVVRIISFLILLIVVAVSASLVVHWLENQSGMGTPDHHSEHYEKTIEAIEQYHSEQGQYPADLSALVPDYLAGVPGIYIEDGEVVEYLPLPSLGAPFTFYVYGHHTGRGFLRKWEEWELRYCPQDTCAYPSAHYPPQRVNTKWIWIYRPETRPLLGRQVVLLRRPEPTPLPGWRYPTSELFVDEDAFPEGWETMPVGGLTMDPTVNHVAREWGQEEVSGIASQSIWRAYTVPDAERRYNELRASRFEPSRSLNPGTLFIPFEPPVEVSYQSQVADEFYLACGWWGAACCKVVARYRNYAVELYLEREAEHGGHSTHGLGYSEIETVVRAMDARFAEVMATLP